MRRIVLVATIIVCFCGSANAQKKGFTANFLTLAPGIDLNDSGLSALSLNIAPGYNFNDRVSLKLNCELVVGLYDVKPVRTYELNGILGAEVGYNFIRSKSDLLEGKLMLGHSVGDNKASDNLHRG